MGSVAGVLDVSTYGPPRELIGPACPRFAPSWVSGPGHPERRAPARRAQVRRAAAVVRVVRQPGMSPAALAQRYFAPSTATGFSVV